MSAWVLNIIDNITIPRSAPHTDLAVRDEVGASTTRVSELKKEQCICINHE